MTGHQSPPKAWNIDRTINLPTVFMIVGFLVGSITWIEGVNLKLDQIGQLIAHTDKLDARLTAIEVGTYSTLHAVEENRNLTLAARKKGVPQ